LAVISTSLAGGVSLKILGATGGRLRAGRVIASREMLPTFWSGTGVVTASGVVAGILASDGLGADAHAAKEKLRHKAPICFKRDEVAPVKADCAMVLIPVPVFFQSYFCVIEKAIKWPALSIR
jgi:hypothetical protein